MAKTKLSDPVLGVNVTQQSVIGVLLQKSEQGIGVLGRFAQQRSKPGESDPIAMRLPGLKSSKDADFSIQIGEGRKDPLVDRGVGQVLTSTERAAQRPKQRPSMPFVKQLQQILAECMALGFTNTKVAFCIAPPDVTYLPLQETIVETQGKEKTKKPPPTGTLTSRQKKNLLQQVSKLHTESFDAKRVDFLSLGNENSPGRKMAFIPAFQEPVAVSLERMLELKGTHPPTSKILDSEITVYANLLRRSSMAQPRKRTALVRVGSNDTLVMFFEGPELHDFEILRSVTTFDPTETVCSRVMLHQDELKFGNLDHMLVISEAPDDTLQDTFSTYYPNAVVEPAHRLLEEQGIRIDGQSDAMRSAQVVAMGVGLRLLEGWDREEPAGLINLMPRKLLKKDSSKMPIWQFAAVLAIIFCMTLFFVWRYLSQEEAIEQRRQELVLTAPEPVLTDPAVLQRRVDSLQLSYEEYTRSLHVLDSLLVGSERWSRFLDEMTRSVRNVSGVWINRWDVGVGMVTLDGTALTRRKVAQLSRVLNGSVEKMDSDEVRDETKRVTVHHFSMIVPLPNEVPRVVEFLQRIALNDEALEELSSSPESMPSGYEATPIINASRAREQNNQ